MLNLLPGIESTSAALNAERLRMDVVSQNLANLHTTRGPDGRPYQRQQVVFESVLRHELGADPAGGLEPREVRVARIESSNRPPRLVHQPGHPDADANGMVALPDINAYEEMVDMMSASRAFEANLAAVKTARSLAMQTLTIGRR
jgi:flagellar basal-body rod protein FlgC